MAYGAASAEEARRSSPHREVKERPIPGDGQDSAAAADMPG